MTGTTLFDMTVPEDELQPQGFEPMPTALYRATLQPGAEIATNDAGWKGIRLPFAGFTDTKTGKHFKQAQRAQFTVEHPNGGQPVEIGQRNVIGAASAFGLAEVSQNGEGAKSYKLAAGSYEELVEQFNAVAGAEALVYVKTGPRRRKNEAGVHELQLKDDGTAWIDSEIKSVRAVESA